MSSQKRKSEASAEKRPEKKQKAAKPTSERPAHTTILQEEEKAFPRGGTSVLTPLEKRQIQNQAKQDVLFEQSTGKKVTTEIDSEDEGEDDLPGEQESAPKNKKGHNKRPRSTSKSKSGGKGAEEAELKIEGLSYRRIVPGSIVLGQVSGINRYDVTVSLPNNLTGYVPLTAISEKVTQTIENIAALEDSNSDIEDTEDPEELKLEDYVRIGQYVRAYVTSIGVQDQKGQKQGNKRRILLSLIPEQTNNGISRSDVIENNVVQASVQSVEDHGLVMKVGINDSDVKAFMSSKELPANMKLADVKPGAIFLCLITGLSSNGKVLKLSASELKLGNLKKTGCLTDAPSVDAFQPGCAVEVFISSTTSTGVTGKIMGLLDVTVDLIHCAAYSNKTPLEKRFPVGSKTKARVICNFPTSEEKKLGVSFLPHLLHLSQPKSAGSDKIPTDLLSISANVDNAKVSAVQPGVGVFMDLGVKGIQGFAHISRLSDEKISDINEDSGPFKLGSVHTSRVVGYNPVDGLFILSMEKSTIDLPYLHLDDVKAGDVVKASVEKFISNASGSKSIILRLTPHIDGLVPETHISDVQLHNPEKKFKEGAKVTARVLSVDLGRRRLRLTLKKSLVNSDSPIWSSYNAVTIGSQSPGTIVNIVPAGAVIQFYGDMRGFLPVSQMSETFIQDPQQHFRIGQVVNTHVLSVEPENKRMTLSCRDLSLHGPQQQEAFEQINVGAKITGLVLEKTHEDVVLEAGDAKLKTMLHVDQLADGSAQKCQHAAKRIRVGQTLSGLMVISKAESKHLLYVTNKPALIKAETSGTFPKLLSNLQIGQEVVGFVRNITETAVYVQFGAGLTGLLPRKQIAEASLQLPAFGLRKYATITCRVLSINATEERFVLTQREAKDQDVKSKTTNEQPLVEPVDDNVHSIADLCFGRRTKARITGVKESQLNVSLAEGVQGRVDISQVFDSWEDIKNRKRPLSHFKTGDIIPVRVMGAHNHRNHRYLPLSNAGKIQVLELTAKKSDLAADTLELLTIDKLKNENQRICFVNNVASDCLWVNITPNVRGRIRAIDASDDTSVLSNLSETFPIGSAIRARIISVDIANNHLDLTARVGSKEAPKSLNDLSEGMVLPGKITRVSERQVMIQLSDNLSGPVHLVEMADDYALINPGNFEKNQVVRVHVTGIDLPNKRLVLSMRPSKVLSSSLPVVDRDFKSLDQLKVNDVVRGFVKNVANNGLFVTVSSHTTAFVRVSELSDTFLKDWKSDFEIDQLVRGKVISIDSATDHLQISLKRSVVENKNYKPPITYHDLKVGQVVTGRVRKVEDFGAFIVIENSSNVSGLCHRSEMADEPVTKVKSLYQEGDMVKAKVLKVDIGKRRIALGLKASYFQSSDAMDLDDSELDSDDDNSHTDGVALAQIDTDMSSDEEDDTKGFTAMANANMLSESDSEDDDGSLGGDLSTGSVNGVSTLPNRIQGLNVGKMDWNGTDPEAHNQNISDSESDLEQAKKKKTKKEYIEIDRTDELNNNAPRSVADFERLLMTEPNSSYLWLSYMAHYLQLNEVAKAREIAERAVKTVSHQRRETEDDALNVWVGYLNLENTYGSDETVTSVFERASQYNDSEEIHKRLTSIYIQSGKNEKADDLLQNMIKRFSQDPRIWLNYADYLFTQDPVKGRDLLPRALQALPKHHHLDLTTKFAQLEFKSEKGNPERGRTMFEGLINTYPKRLDLYNILLDLEQKTGDKDQVRRLFQRVTSGKLKPKQAKYFFKRWLEYEEKFGDVKSVGKVKARAEDYVRKQKDNEASKSDV